MPLPVQSNGEKVDPATREAERFEGFYQGILEMNDVLERIEQFAIKRRMREIISRLEDDFVNCPEFTVPRTNPLKELRLGLAGGSLSSKSSLVHRYLNGFCPKEEVLSGRHKKDLTINGKKYLLLVRDETGPPDPQFSKWVDAIMLVFSYADELSFNVISSYYAKMQQYKDNHLPVILVGIRDESNCDVPNTINNARIRKFIADHNNCQFFLVSLETGENVEEVFQTAAEMIVRARSNPALAAAGFDDQVSPLPNNLSTSCDTLITSGYGSSMSIMSQGSLKKAKKKGVFSKPDKKDEKPDDFGSGRVIPTKQGYLYKRSHNSLKEWKKKYVTICDNGTLVYYANMKEYIEENNGKSINLAHTTVKIPGKRPPKLTGNQKNITMDISTCETPKKQPQKRNSVHKDYDAVIISNSLAASPNQSKKPDPDVENAVVKATQGIISTGIHGTPKNGASPTKKKNRRHGGRHAKSCEIDYRQFSSDLENGVQGTPLSARRRASHKRNKSGAAKELQFEKGTDTEDDDMLVFTIISLDGKSWDFESTSSEDRDVWVNTIEQQILRAFQTGIASPKKERPLSGNLSPGLNSVKSALRIISGNDRCADCGSPDPEWASINLGILVCIECSGVHRNLGTHLSRVRSLDLDDWPSECLEVMKLIGNEFANTLWESKIPGKRKLYPNSSREDREDWIHRKYENKEFLHRIDTSRRSIGQQIFDTIRTDDKRTCYSLLIQSAVNDVNVRTNDGRNMTPLHLSCKLGNTIITQLLLWYFGDPRALDADGFTSMSYARDSENKESVELLSHFGCPEDTPC